MKSIVIKFVSDTKQFTAGANRVVKTINNVKKGVVSANGSINKLTKNLNKSSASMGKFATQSKKAGNALGGIGKRVPKPKPVLTFRDSIKSLANEIPIVSRLGSVISKIPGPVKLAAVAVIGLGFALGKMVSTGLKVEKTLAKLKTIFQGNEESAVKMFTALDNISATTNLNSEQISRAGSQLLAVGVAANKVEPMIRRIGDVSAAFGKDFVELATIMSKNKSSIFVQGEDLNQLLGAGIPVFKELATVLGTTTDKVKKLASQNKVTFTDLDDAFKLMTSKGGNAFNAMSNDMDTVGGSFRSISASATRFWSKLSGAEKGKGTLTFWNELRSIMKSVASTFSSFVRANADNLQAIGATIGIIFSTVFNGLKPILAWFLFTLNLSLKIAGLVAKIFVAIVSVIRRFVNFVSTLISDTLGMLLSTEKTTSSVLKAFRSIVTFIGNFINKIKILLFLVGEFAISIADSISSQFEKIGDKIRGFIGLAPSDKTVKQEIDINKTTSVKPIEVRPPQPTTGQQQSVRPQGTTNTTTVNNVDNRTTGAPVTNIQQTVLIPTQTEAERTLNTLNLSGSM